MGFDELDQWLTRYAATDYVDLRIKLGVDLLAACPVYTGAQATSDLSIWGTPCDCGGSQGAGYSGCRGAYSLADAQSVSDVERFNWPDPGDFDFDAAASALSRFPSDKARWVKAQYAVQPDGIDRVNAARGGGRWLPLLCRLFDLFGLEKTLVMLHTNPKVIEAATRQIEGFTLAFVGALLDATAELVDVFWYGDDFAGQTGMLISPEQWRRLFKPTYHKVFDLAKSYGLNTWFHSCGTFRPVLPDLIDIGMDVWETVQVHLPGNEPEALKREYGRDIAFYGAINSQRTLPFGSEEEVRAEVRARINVLGKGGGYICGPDHSILPDVPAENVLAMLDEARRHQPV